MMTVSKCLAATEKFQFRCCRAKNFKGNAQYCEQYCIACLLRSERVDTVALAAEEIVPDSVYRLRRRGGILLGHRDFRSTRLCKSKLTHQDVDQVIPLVAQTD